MVLCHRNFYSLIDLHFRNYEFKDENFIDSYLVQWFSEFTHNNEIKYEVEFFKNYQSIYKITESNYFPLSEI